MGSSACSSVFSQEQLESYGLDEEQMRNLKRTFDQFDSDKSVALSVDTVHMILKMMGIHVSTMAVQEIVDEIDEDESGLLEFPEFVQLAAKFLIEEDEEQMKWAQRSIQNLRQTRQRIHYNRYTQGNSP